MQSTIDFLLNIIPTTVVDAFAKGEILQVLLFAVLFGFALHALGEPRHAGASTSSTRSSHVLFAIVGIIMSWRRSARSARWRSRSASTASARCCRSAS